MKIFTTSSGFEKIINGLKHLKLCTMLDFSGERSTIFLQLQEEILQPSILNISWIHMYCDLLIDEICS